MSEAKQLNVYQRLLEAQAHIVAPRQESRFKGGSRSAEQILEAAKPACRQFGLLLVTNEEIEFIGERNRIKATATVINVDNPDERISSSASAWEGELTTGLDASQVSGKTGSYAKKYALQDLFAIDDTKDADFDDIKPPKTAAAPSKPAQAASVPTSHADPAKGQHISDKQLKFMATNFGQLGITESEGRHEYVKKVVGHEVASSTELTLAEAKRVIDRQLADLDDAASQGGAS